MLQPLVFLTGYRKILPKEIEVFRVANHALVLDIRFNAHSPHPVYRPGALKVTFGAENYLAFPEFGNPNYKNGLPIYLKDPRSGFARIQKIGETRQAVILLCGCVDESTCHRTFAGAFLERLGYTVAEIKVPVTEVSVTVQAHEESLTLADFESYEKGYDDVWYP